MSKKNRRIRTISEAIEYITIVAPYGSESLLSDHFSCGAYHYQPEIPLDFNHKVIIRRFPNG
jgi:hypothetical protein